MLQKTEFIKLVVKAGQKALMGNMDALNYLTFKREIYLDSIKNFEVGYLSRNIIEKFIADNSLNDEAVEYGLVNKFSGLGFFDNHVIFPIKNGEEYVSLYGRYVGNSDSNHANLPGLRKNIFFNQDVINDKPALIVTESIIDAVTLHQNGFMTVSGLGACLTSDQIELLRDKIVYILFDLDSAGIEATRELCKKLWGVAKKIYPLKFPCYTTIKLDANSYFCKYSTAKGTLQTLIKNSQEFKGAKFGLKGKQKKIKSNGKEYNIVEIGKKLIPNRIERGHGFWCKCPLHKAGNERTHSMFVGGLNAPRNMFYCFGCGQGGGAVYFVSKVLSEKTGKRVEFQEAEDWIVENLGV